VRSNGSLTPVPGSPFPASSWQQQALIDPTGSYLYTASYYTESNVEAFDINRSTGALTPMAGEPFNLPDQQTNCAMGAYDMAFAQNGQHLVVPEYCDGVIAVFDVNSNGTLTNAHGSPVIDTPPGGTVDLQAIAVDPLNRWWYLYEFFPGEIPDMDVATFTATNTTERNPDSNCGDIIRADPSGKFVYAIGNTTGNGVCGVGPSGAILGFSVNQSNGTLTALPGSPFPSPNADYSDEDGLVVTQ
jgi:6-phosphogluconolactonase (cycloisomerase 2 family)